jgi:hypothetical protein
MMSQPIVSTVEGEVNHHEGCMTDTVLTWVITYGEASEFLQAYRELMQADSSLWAEGVGDMLAMTDMDELRQRQELLVKMKDSLIERGEIYNKFARLMADVWEGLTPEQRKIETQMHRGGLLQQVEGEEEGEDDGVRVD